jgi:putative phosphoribosyl transferase
LVIFAHGSGSGRLSPRNNRVAAALQGHRLATLLIDLLTPTEEHDRANVFDVALLASRLSSATDWALAQSETAHLPIGYFGASTGAGAALAAAAVPRSPVAAIVSRGGRPDLAGDALAGVTAPTLLIVGSRDAEVVALNRVAYDRIVAPKELVIIEGAGHLFEEPGTLQEVQRHATRWFRCYLAGDKNA